MDDPWAAPSWSAPDRQPSIPSIEPPPEHPASDPWTTPAVSGPGTPPSPRAPKLPTSPLKETESDLGWKESASWSADNSPVLAPIPTLPQSPVKLKDEAVEQDVWADDPVPLPGSPGVPSQSAVDVAMSVELPATPKVSTTPTFASPNRSILASSPLSPHRSGLPASSSHASLSEAVIGGFGGFESPTKAASPLSGIPKSPSFGDDFGGFAGFGASSSDYPWGPKPTVDSTRDNDGWGESDWEQPAFGRSTPDISATNIVPEETAAESGDEGWGSAAPREAVTRNLAREKEEDEWEEAQRKIRVTEERAPPDKIEEMKNQWTKLAEANMAGAVDLVKMTGAEELQYEQVIGKVFEDASERIRSLATIPPDINTYPPVLSSLVTHDRYTYALQRPNSDPESSLLHTASRAVRRPRRIDPIALSLATGEASWTTRSRLGEPDQDLEAAVGDTGDGKSKWSFWGRRPTAERKLTTGGGGALEVKPMTPTSTGSGADKPRPSTESKPPSLPASRAPSIAGPSSRAASPAPSILSAAPETQQPAAPQGPSAVSRFFGRLSRRPSSQPDSPTTPNAPAGSVDAKDLELSADDFSFLAEVPSMSTPPPGKGVADLLDMEPGANEPIKSLENLLNSKVAPLPKPLAPPSSGFSAPSYGGMGGERERKSSGKFVAKMKAPQPTDVDLLGGLDFASSTTSAVSPTSASSAVPAQGTGGSTWGDFESFMSSSPTSGSMPAPIKPSRSSTPAVVPPPHSPPPIIAPTAVGMPFAALSLQPPMAPSGISPASSVSPAPQLYHSVKTSTEMQGFGKAGTPRDEEPSGMLSPSAIVPAPDPATFAFNGGMLAPTEAAGMAASISPEPQMYVNLSTDLDLEGFGKEGTPRTLTPVGISPAISPAPAPVRVPAVMPGGAVAFSTAPPVSRAAISPAPAAYGILSDSGGDDFGDFGSATPSRNATPAGPEADFDDFGDFTSSSPPAPTPPTKPASQSIFTSPSRPALILPTPKNSPPKPHHDHTPAMKLMTRTNSVKGKRWPAPPSPLPQILEPPPKSGGSSGGFPFLAPPPGGVKQSKGDLMGDLADTVGESANGNGLEALGTAPVAALPSTGGLKPKPSPASAVNNGNSGGGLSAQDLSFFDSI
ncbi:hypothetical protein IAR50_002074 [Cryptococcus sp. DSM 104548]